MRKFATLQNSVYLMKILLIHQFLWSHYKAGIFTELTSLVKASSADTLKIIQTAKYEKSRLDFGEADTSIHDYPYELLHDGVYEDTTLLYRFFQVAKRLLTYNPDVINLPGYYEPAMVLIHFLARLMGIKVILSIDSTENDNPSKWYTELIKKIIIKNADGFFCYGTLAADYMLKLGAKPEEILMRRNSVNNDLVKEIFDQYKMSNDYRLERNKLPTNNFIYVGRFLEIKNIRRLIEAFKALKDNKNWGLILVGDGPMKSEIEQLVKGEETINIFPPQDWRGVPEKMALAEVLILPSYSEPWGLVTNEAMVCQMPVIVSNKAGSSADLVKETENGFTFDPYDVKDLTEKMQYFIDNPEAVSQMGLRSVELIKSFSPKQVAAEMYAGFKKVVR